MSPTLQAPGKTLRLDNPIDQRKEKMKQVLSYVEVILSTVGKRVVMSGGSVYPLALQQIKKDRQIKMSGWTGLALMDIKALLSTSHWESIKSIHIWLVIFLLYFSYKTHFYNF